MQNVRFQLIKCKLLIAKDKSFKRSQSVNQGVKLAYAWVHSKLSKMLNIKRHTCLLLEVLTIMDSQPRLQRNIMCEQIFGKVSQISKLLELNLVVVL